MNTLLDTTAEASRGYLPQTYAIEDIKIQIDDSRMQIPLPQEEAMTPCAENTQGYFPKVNLSEMSLEEALAFCHNNSDISVYVKPVFAPRRLAYQFHETPCVTDVLGETHNFEQLERLILVTAEAEYEFDFKDVA